MQFQCGVLALKRPLAELINDTFTGYLALARLVILMISRKDKEGRDEAQLED